MRALLRAPSTVLSERALLQPSVLERSLALAMGRARETRERPATDLLYRLRRAVRPLQPGSCLLLETLLGATTDAQASKDRGASAPASGSEPGVGRAQP